MTDSEFNQYKFQVLAKSNGMNIHRVHNMLGAMETSIKEYSQTRDRSWLRVAGKARQEINRVIYN